MSIQQIFNPPRYPTAPQTPLPQTVLGVIEHSGFPVSQPELVTDIPPDFGWMSAMQEFIVSFEMNKTQSPGTVLGEHNFVHCFQDAKPEEYYPYWTELPYFGSKWWSGIISYKLIAIKPPRVTGKILISYSFDSAYNFDDNRKKLAISKEWDLGQSNVCEFDVSALNQLRLRPTRIPVENINEYPNEVPSFVFQSQALPSHSWNLGKIRFEVASQLQPGNLFPDSIRILIFKSFKNFQGYIPTDFRGSMITGVSTRYLPAL